MPSYAHRQTLVLEGGGAKWDQGKDDDEKDGDYMRCVVSVCKSDKTTVIAARMAQLMNA